MITWKENRIQLAEILEKSSVRDTLKNEFDMQAGFKLWHDWTLRVRELNKCVYLIGNGASATMASHFATDMAKNVRVRAHVFTDLSLITALANDTSYDQVFAEPLRWQMTEGDMLVAISSSGNSPNVLRGAEVARSFGGTIITLSGMSEENALRKLGDLNFYAPAETYGLAETSHAAMLHYWTDLMTRANKMG